MTPTDLLGWGSSLILLATLMRQVYTQWRTHASVGISKWLFLGQVTASVGYVIYSFLLHNWVFLCSNIAILFTALLGEILYIRSRKRRPTEPSAPPATADTKPSC